MDKITANNDPERTIPANEAHLYHLELATKENNPATKEYIRRAKVQSFTVIDFHQMKQTGFFKNYDEVIVIHNPELKEKKSIKAPEKAEKAVAKGKGKAEKAVAKKEVDENLASLRVEYLALYQAEADSDATAEDLEELIDAKKSESDPNQSF